MWPRNGDRRYAVRRQRIETALYISNVFFELVERSHHSSVDHRAAPMSPR